MDTFGIAPAPVGQVVKLAGGSLAFGIAVSDENDLDDEANAEEDDEDQPDEEDR